MASTAETAVPPSAGLQPQDTPVISSNVPQDAKRADPGPTSSSVATTQLPMSPTAVTSAIARTTARLLDAAARTVLGERNVNAPAVAQPSPVGKTMAAPSDGSNGQPGEDAVIPVRPTPLDDDMLDLLKAPIVAAPIFEPHSPGMIFPHALALYPDGSVPLASCLPASLRQAPKPVGVAHRRYVKEELVNDDVFESLPAYHELVMAAEAVSARRSVERQAGVADDAARLAWEDTGLVDGKAPKVMPHNAKAVARRELRAQLHGLASKAAAQAALANAAASHGAVVTAPAPAASGQQAIAQLLQPSLAVHPAAHVSSVASLLLPMPLDDPCDPWPARVTTTAAPELTASAGNPRLQSSSVVGGLRSTIGNSSMEQGAVTATEYELRADIKAKAAHLLAAGAGNTGGAEVGGLNPTVLAQAANQELPLLRIVRPLGGDAVELALAGSEPATLALSVSGVSFRDHPLFSAEDYLASGLKGLFAQYVRRMKANVVASLDARLRALLSFTVQPIANGLDASMGGAGAVAEVYDFERDSLPDLCARCGAVLEALSLRYEEVTSTGELMTRMWQRWTDLRRARSDSGVVLTPLRLDVQEVTGSSQALIGGNGMVVPVLYPLLNSALRLLHHLQLAAHPQDGTAAGLVALGQTLMAKIKDNEIKFGEGYGCGGMGSAVPVGTDVQAAAPPLQGAAAADDAGGSNTFNPSTFQYPGAREYVFHLWQDQSVTPFAAVPLLERKRRAAIAACWVALEVLVNGDRVAMSPAAQLQADFRAAATVSIALRLYRRPASIVVRVCDVSSALWRVFGAPVLTEVLIPVPGNASARNGQRTDGDDADGLATLSTSAIEPIVGVFEFSASQPMRKPYWDASRPTTNMAAPAVLNAGSSNHADGGIAAAPASPLAPITSGGASSSGFTHQRLLCGSVAVTCAWSLAPVGGKADNTATSAHLQPVPAFDAHAPEHRMTSALAGDAGVLGWLRRTASDAVEGLTAMGGPTLVGARFANSRGINGLANPEVLAELAMLPVPKAVGAGEERAAAAPAMSVSTSAATPGFGASSVPTTPSRRNAGGVLATSSASAGAPPTPGHLLSRSATIRRSQVLASAEVALAATAAGASSAVVNVMGVDANDPRMVAGHFAHRGSRPRGHRFRATAIPPALSLGPAFALGGGMGAGALDLATRTMAIYEPLPGQKRNQLLRLRSERPDLFIDTTDPVPLTDADLSASAHFVELLRSALVALGFSEHTADAMQHGPLAYLRQGARALGMAAPDNKGGVGQWGVTGGGTAAAAASARLLAKVQDFLRRVKSSPAGRLRFLRTVYFSTIIKELSLPAVRAFVCDERVLLACLAPRRKLRPRAVDLGIPADLTPGLSIASALLPAPSVASVYRITVQVVRARNVPVRRPALPPSALRTSGTMPTGLMSPGMGMIPNSPAPAAMMSVNGYDPSSVPWGAESSDTVVAVVEARFQGHAVRSTASPGPNPQWNQVLTLPFIPPGQDFTPGKLAEIDDNVVISLFDEVALEGRADDRDKMTTLVRRHRRWLGSAAIPFFSLYSQGSIRAEVRMETPVVNLGYRAPSTVHVGASTGLAPGGAARMGNVPGAVAIPMSGNLATAPAPMGVAAPSMPTSDAVGIYASADANRRTTHLYLHISIDPPLPMSGDDDEDGDDRRPHDAAEGPLGGPALQQLRQLRSHGAPEGIRLLEFAARWSDRYASQMDSYTGKRGRAVKAIVSNIMGEAVLLTRYLCPQAPPPDPAAAVAAYEAQKAAQRNMRSAARGGAGHPRTPPRGDDRDYAGEEAEGALELPTSSDTLPIVSPMVARMANVDAIVRYVSLIPFLSDSRAFGSANVSADLWATSQEFLEMGAGDSEEHAILLHNYLTWLDSGGNTDAAAAAAASASGNTSSGWRTYIVMGVGQPEGDTVYVLRQSTGGVAAANYLINASTGRAFVATDDTCPLLSVGLVANQHNVWANIQPWTEPWRIQWDFSDNRYWAPLFTPLRPHPGLQTLPAIQPAISYRTPDEKMAFDLQQEIDGALSAALRSWRPRYVTRIRGDLTKFLQPLLFELEARAMGNSGAAVLPTAKGLQQANPGGKAIPVHVGADGLQIIPTRNDTASAGGGALTAGGLPAAFFNSAARDLSAEHQVVLERLISGHRAYGFPVHATFTDLHAVLNAVKATGIHRIEDENVQYALAVAVIPYPSDIFSVWVYAVCFLPV